VTAVAWVSPFRKPEIVNVSTGTVVPGAIEALVAITTSTALLMVMVSEAVPVPRIFVALIVTLNTPICVGVPLMTPLLVLMFKPLGNVPPVTL
jgi:hypothetical protein